MDRILENKNSSFLSNVLVGALILCFAAFNNKFPLLFEESGIYIKDGFSLPHVVNSKLLYSLFVAHTSWGKSLWLVIYFQSLILATVINYYFRYFVPYKKNRSFFYFGYLFLISFLMSASIAASTISPVLFGSISILAVGLLVLIRKMILRDRIIVSIIAVLSTAMAFSSIVIAVMIPLLYFVINLINRRNTIKAFPITIVNIGIVNVVSIVLFSILPIGPGNSASKHNLPGFLRAFDHIEPFNKSGGGVSADTKNLKNKSGIQGNQILNRKSEYLKSGTSESFSIIKVMTIKAYERPQVNGRALNAVEEWFSGDIRECYLSKQREGSEKFIMIGISQWIFLILSIVISLYALSISRIKYKGLIFYFFTAFLLNIVAVLLFNDAQKNNLWSFVWVVPLPLFLMFSAKTDLKFI